MDKIRDIRLRLEAPISLKDVQGIGLNIKGAMFGLQRRIFMNKSLGFRVWDDSDVNELIPKLLGTLIVLEDEYMVDELYPDNMGYW